MNSTSNLLKRIKYVNLKHRIARVSTKTYKSTMPPQVKICFICEFQREIDEKIEIAKAYGMKCRYIGYYEPEFHAGSAWLYKYVIQAEKGHEKNFMENLKKVFDGYWVSNCITNEKWCL